MKIIAISTLLLSMSSFADSINVSQEDQRTSVIVTHTTGKPDRYLTCNPTKKALRDRALKTATEACLKEGGTVIHSYASAYGYNCEIIYGCECNGKSVVRCELDH